MVEGEAESPLYGSGYLRPWDERRRRDHDLSPPPGAQHLFALLVPGAHEAVPQLTLKDEASGDGGGLPAKTSRRACWRQEFSVRGRKGGEDDGSMGLAQRCQQAGSTKTPSDQER